MTTYDFSRAVGLPQRIFFALWGMVQLVASSVAFQRGGFAYGLGVLLFGIAAFSAAIFVVHRFNRHRISVGDVGLVVEEGPTRARAVPWDHIEEIARSGERIEALLKTRSNVLLSPLALDGEHGVGRLNALWSEMRSHAAERSVSIRED